jgi:hypothetical protein
MNTGAFVALAASAHLVPEHLARLLRHSQAAWEAVLFAVEVAVLWLWVGASSRLIALQAAATWGAMESAQRGACRLAFPMDRPPPKVQGQNLCDIATGLPVSWVSVVAALFVACIAQEAQNAKR